MDQPVEKALKKAIKKARWMQWLIIAPVTVVILFIISIILLVSAYKIGNEISSVQHAHLHKRLFLTNSIMQPNVRIDSQVTRDGSMFGGTLVTNRSKDINGYLVPWSTLESQYTWFTAKIDQNELIPGSYSNGTTRYEYDKQTKQKVANFYHPDVAEYYDGVQNHLPQLLEMENYVAEMAISFREPMTFNEIKAFVPNNLNIVWFYMVSRITNEKNGPSGVQVYGYNDTNISEDGYKQFMNNLVEYHGKYMDSYMNDYIADNKDKPFNEVKVLGVLLTGRTENFAPLLGHEAVRGASVGVTVPIVPYIIPSK